MWQGRLLELLGIWLIVAGIANYGAHTNAWINIGTGVAVIILGLVSRKFGKRRGQVVAGVGILLILAAFVPPLMAPLRQQWLDGVAGLVVWFCGWKLVSAESGGPWRLKDKPTF